MTPEQLDSCTTLSGPQPGRITGNDFYVGGLDLGWRRDRTGFVVLGANIMTGKTQLAHAVDWNPKAFGGELPLYIVESEVWQIHTRFDLAGICFDPREAVGLAQRLGERGIRMMRMNTTPQAQQDMVKALLQGIGNEEVELYPHAGLRNDLLGLSIAERSYGLKLVADRTDAGHADLAIAFVYGLTLARMWIEELRNAPAEPEYEEYIVV